MNKPLLVLIAAFGLIGGAVPVTAKEAPTKGCDRKKARPANPHGTVLVPVSTSGDPRPPVAPDDDVVPIRKKRGTKVSAASPSPASINFQSC